MVEGLYPHTVKEALQFRRNYPGAMLMAGGTDLMVTRKTAEHTIFLNEVEEMQQVSCEQGLLQIGATATYSDLIANPLIPEILKTAMRKIASPAIRSAGSMGGNICNASPAGDTLPVLYALDAVVVKAYIDTQEKVQKERVPIEQFILGIRKIALKPEEIVIAIEIPQESYTAMTSTYYEKIGARESEVISKLSFIGMAKVTDNKVADLRIAFGSVGITVIRRKELETQMIGLTLTELARKKDNIVKEYENCINPIDDQRSTAVYRKKVCLNLLEDFLSR